MVRPQGATGGAGVQEGRRGLCRAEDRGTTIWPNGPHEDWATKSGKASGETGERYLPKKARESLTDAEYKRTTAKKRADSAKGQQFSAQPQDVARKTAAARTTKAELMERAAKKGIPGRSRMTKDQLQKALG